MKTAVYRLLTPKKLGPVKKGPEDLIAIEFATWCRAASMERRLRGVWTHIPHEVGGGNGRLSQARYALAQAMGFITGSGDFVFVAPERSLFIELKAGKRGQTPAQKDWESWCIIEGVPYAVCKSAQSAIDCLQHHGFIR